MTKLMLPAVLLFAFAAAGAQEPPAEPSEGAVEELSQLLLQQKEIIEAQARELEELKKRLSEVEALALSSHNRLEEIEQRPEEATVTGAVEQRLAELEQQVQDKGLLSPDSWWALFYGSGADVRKYVSITAFTGLLGAIANFLLLLALGVDAAALWASLSFLLNFIPNFGFILSVIPPALLALLEFGPGRAMIVVVGFILVNAVVENVLKPRFIGQELELSALEILLSLLFWSWLLGAIGAIVAVPLTIVVKRLIPVIATGISLPAAQSHSR